MTFREAYETMVKMAAPQFKPYKQPSGNGYPENPTQRRFGQLVRNNTRPRNPNPGQIPIKGTAIGKTRAQMQSDIDMWKAQAKQAPAQVPQFVPAPQPQIPKDPQAAQSMQAPATQWTDASNTDMDIPTSPVQPPTVQR